MWIKPLKNGKFVVMPDMAEFTTYSEAYDYTQTKPVK